MTHRTRRTRHHHPRLPGVVLLAAAASLGPLAACSSSHSSSVAKGAEADSTTVTGAAQRTSACRPVPAAGASLPWLPADLPLPSGSYAVQDVDAAAPPPSVATSVHRGLLAVHTTVDGFTAFVKSDWVSRGWTLGKGDAERGEAEGGFRRGSFGGSYRVRDVYCDPAFSELLVVYGKAGS